MSYTLHKAKILIVDDMRPMLSLTASILKIFGFSDVITAENGQEGFDMFCRYNPDLIVTDWIMTPVDGLEMTRMIRRDKASPNPFVPILVMTGYSSRLRVERARDMGITEFLVKPFSSEDLYRRIVQIIEKPRQFVEAEEFFGPDRRRRLSEGYEGPRRRESDEDNNDIVFSEILKKLKEEAKQIKT